MRNKFNTANDAFHHFYWSISVNGNDFADTKALFNVGFTIKKPWERNINNRFPLKREWKRDYAEAEWQWYLSGDRNIHKLEDIYGKVPQIWKHMADDDGNVNSNYGWQWKRNDQLDMVIQLLKDDPKTRQAAVSIYDSKEWKAYEYDTPCTYAVQFTILKNKLNMSVVMRSNDLWYGFCNDQYCFSRLQSLVAREVGVEMGEYYHFAHNLHIYNNKLPNAVNWINFKNK